MMYNPIFIAEVFNWKVEEEIFESSEINLPSAENTCIGNAGFNPEMFVVSSEFEGFGNTSIGLLSAKV